MNEKIEAMETKLEKAYTRVDRAHEEGSYEELADAYERAFGIAVEIIEEAISLLRKIEPGENHDQT